MMMRASPVIQTPKLGVFPFTSYFQLPGDQANRTYGVEICYPQQLCFCQSESVPQSLCVAEKEEEEEAKAVLTPNSKKLRAKKLGAMARVSEIGYDGQPHSLVLHPTSRMQNKRMDQIKSITRRQPGFASYSLEGEIEPVVEFLLVLGINRADIATILSRRPSLLGLSVTENLIPTMMYLENLGVDNKKWAKVIYRYPELLTYSTHKLKTTVDYLYELGLTAESVGKILTWWPKIVSYSVEENLRPTAEYFRSLGVDIAILGHRAPQVMGLSLTKNLIPSMTYLEKLGVDKKKWAKVIYRSPGLLICSREKVKSIVDFFYELGLTAESVGKILTRYPQIVGCNVEQNLRPTAEYFSSLGVDVAVLVHRAPQVLCLSIEKNLIPKWEFFLTMDYPTSELVKFPQYFGYSLEERIKPRYALIRECGVKLSLNQALTDAEPAFEKLLKRKMKKKLDELGSNMEELTLTIPNIQ